MIGVFDSGYGGLTVLGALLKQLPQYDYLYLGDNGRAPYGGRNKETILKYSREAVEFLFGRGCRLIIMACNAVSAVALKELQEEFVKTNSELRSTNDEWEQGAEEQEGGGGGQGSGVGQDVPLARNILGVIFPLVEKAAEMGGRGKHGRGDGAAAPRIGVVGTRVTIESGAYERELKKLRPEAAIYGQACPLLVPFIEEGWESKPEALTILRKYLRPLKTYNLDTLILGCTHYPLMHKAFERGMGKNVCVLDTGPTVAESLEDYLKRHPEIEGGLGREGDEALASLAPGRRIFCTTGDPKRFEELGSRFLGQAVTGVERVVL